MTASPLLDPSSTAWEALVRPARDQDSWKAAEGPQEEEHEEGVSAAIVLQFVAADQGQHEGPSCFLGTDAPAEGGSAAASRGHHTGHGSIRNESNC